MRTTPTLFGLLAVASATIAMAQTPPPTSPDNTSPSSASSPQQRDTTSSHATEPPATNGTDPSAASSPHQQQATAGRSSHKQMMKDCMAKEKAKSTGMSKDEMKKTCANQMQAAPK